MNLTTLLNFLPVAGPVLAKAPEFLALFNEAKALLNPADQELAQAALEDLHQDNAEGFARLDAKLEEAKRR